MTNRDKIIGINEEIKEGFKGPLDARLNKGYVEMLTESDAQDFSYGFYEAQNAIDIAKSMRNSNGKFIISIYDDEDLLKVFRDKKFLFADHNELKEINSKGSYFLVIPKHSLNTLYAKDFKEIREAMNKYLKPTEKNKKHNGADKNYKSKMIKDLARVSFFNSNECIQAYKLAKQGCFADDVKHFDLLKIHVPQSNIDEDLDSVCVVRDDKIKNIGRNNYLILETQCFDECLVNKKQHCYYCSIIVGKLVDFKRIKTENGLEKVVGTVESIDKNDTEELFRACKEYRFKGSVLSWKINDEELVPFKYTKVDIKSWK